MKMTRVMLLIKWRQKADGGDDEKFDNDDIDQVQDEDWSSRTNKLKVVWVDGVDDDNGAGDNDDDDDDDDVDQVQDEDGWSRRD